MTQQAGVSTVTVEHRVIAAEVALRDLLPGVARFFLSRIERTSLVDAPELLRRRFLQAARASRIGST